MNEADFALLDRQDKTDQRIRELESQIEALTIDNKLLQLEVEVLRRRATPRPETLR